MPVSAKNLESPEKMRSLLLLGRRSVVAYVGDEDCLRVGAKMSRTPTYTKQQSKQLVDVTTSTVPNAKT